MFGACKSKKKISDNTPRSFDSASFVSTPIGSDSLLRKKWDYFSGRLALDYVSEDQDLSGNISLRMKRDSIIWFSASASIGIQVAKGIITKDSVKILDLYEKKYITYGIKELGETFGVSIGLREMQNMILANPIFDSLVYQHDNKSGGWFGVENPLTNVIFSKLFAPADSSFLTQKGSMRQLRVNYSGSKSAGSYAVPLNMVIFANSDSKSVRMNLEFTTASDAVIPSYPFTVPPDYERVK